MKYIRKLRPPQLFKDWVDANNAHLQATCSTGDEIWSKLDSRVKKKLVDALLKEQGHICAYCGTRIGKEEFLTFCVEHFKRKGDEIYKNLTLDYSNLLGCCKISQPTTINPQSGKGKDTPFPIPQMTHLKTLKSIADYLDITVENLKKNNNVLKKVDENTDLDIINNQKPTAYQIKELKYAANIHHCDDTKFDSTDDIVNPTTEEDCERYFRYRQSVSHKNEPICEINSKNMLDIRVNNTIKILNLNATNLCTDRVTAYEAGVKFADDLDVILESDLEMPNEEIRSLIQQTLEDIYAKTEEKLDPFCFVTASVVWNRFY